MKFKKRVLKNGMRLITIHMADNPTVTVLVMVEAGSKYEKKSQNGLSHFLEHMCFKGTVKRPKSIDITKELDSIGCQYNAFTSYEFTGYFAKSNPRHIEKILDVVSDIYLNSTFPEQEIEKEKGVIVDEIRMYEDLPYHEVHNSFMELLYGDQPAGWSITGTKEHVRTLNRKDLVDYRLGHYLSKATTVIVSGQFDEKKVNDLIKEKFNEIKQGVKGQKIKVAESQTKPQLVIKNKKTDQAHMVIGVRTFDTYDPCSSALRVLSTILGGGMSSRLFQKLRDEMGVGYYVNSSIDNFTDHGFLDVSVGIDPSRLAEVLSAILEQFKRLKEEPILPEELNKAKEYLIGSMYLGLESSDSLAEFYGYQEVLHKKLQEPKKIASEIRSVTSQDLQRLAKKIFINKHLNVAIIGPFNDAKQFSYLLNV